MRTLAWCALSVGMVAAAAGCQSTPGAAPRQEAPAAAAAAFNPVPPPDLPAAPTPADAAAFAWDSFVALNWPAAANERGVPDRARVIGQPGPVVWTTWKAPDEIFAADGGAPVGWNVYGGTRPPICAGAGVSDLVLERVSKVPGDVDNTAIDLAREVVGGTLTDQHGRLAHFEIRMNRTIFDEIVAKQYYNTQGQDAARSIDLPAGVMEVKAAWRQMTPDDPAAVRSRFYTQQAWIYTPALGMQPATCVEGVVGLVGLHITHKTPSREQWTWATFEQIDNVPGDPGGRAPYSFNNPSCPATQCPPNTSTEKNGTPTGIPTQVTRVIPVGAAAAGANAAYQARLRQAVAASPFQYYQLIDIQWPQRPEQRPDGDPTPGLLANSTMETYVAESSCLHCHYTARTASGQLSSDFTFMLAEAHPRAGGAAR